jgi:transcriptional regulator PpsR
VSIQPTVFRAAGDRVLLCRIEAAGAADAAAAELTHVLGRLYRDGPDGIVFTDAQGVIRSGNEAFLGLTDAGQVADVRGRSLADFLARGSVDLKVLLENAARSGWMRVYSTRLESTFGAQVAVEISATRLGGAAGSGFAFVIRDTSRLEVIREPEAQAPAGGAPMSDDAMRNVMDLVGSAPLKEIVSATTDVVEKMCIETAVELTNNNRVAAAEMLGLSRQSLYVKLRKYGLLNRNEAED